MYPDRTRLRRMFRPDRLNIDPQSQTDVLFSELEKLAERRTAFIPFDPEAPRSAIRMLCQARLQSRSH